MGKLNIKNGTPVGNAHLCKRCTWGQYITGYRESDLLVICMRNDPSIPVPFVVHECTEFSDKHRPTWDQMKRFAINLGTVRVSKTTAGFGTGKPVIPIRDEEGEGKEDVAGN